MTVFLLNEWLAKYDYPVRKAEAEFARDI